MNRKQAILYILLSIVGLNLVIRKWFWNGQYVQFSDFEMLISELCEVIIPSTDTPGAKDAGVAKYIINVMTNCATRYEKITFMNGLDKVKRYRTSSGQTFLSASEDEKKQYVQNLERDAAGYPLIVKRFRNKILGPSFYDQLKWLTVSGYFSSKIGATMALAFDEIPGRYFSCTDVSENQKSWATK